MQNEFVPLDKINFPRVPFGYVASKVFQRDAEHSEIKRILISDNKVQDVEQLVVHFRDLSAVNLIYTKMTRLCNIPKIHLL